MVNERADKVAKAALLPLPAPTLIEIYIRDFGLLYRPFGTGDRMLWWPLASQYGEITSGFRFTLVKYEV